jgi:hypothetical protein
VGVLEDYWNDSAEELRKSFEKKRHAHKDSAVKGSANEGILADFLRENTGATRVALNSEVIDADGRRSDEVDVVVLNENQPLWTGNHGQLLIAEGVDAAYQVKALLTVAELKRAIKNGRSVKQLARPLGAGSWASATDSDGPRFIDHIPFFVFAYESKIRPEKAIEVLTGELKDSPWEAQPDGVFILGSWSVVNVGDNNGMLKIGPSGSSGFNKAERLPALAMMLWCHHLFVHRVVHFRHPLQRYHPFVPFGKS